MNDNLKKTLFSYVLQYSPTVYKQIKEAAEKQ